MNKDIMCEFCEKKEAMSFMFSQQRSVNLACVNCNVGFYAVEFEELFKSYEDFLDWLKHLQGKRWMNWEGFMERFDKIVSFQGRFLWKENKK